MNEQPNNYQESRVEGRGSRAGLETSNDQILGGAVSRGTITSASGANTRVPVSRVAASGSGNCSGKQRQADLEAAQQLANLCEEFLQITSNGATPKRVAANLLGKSPSFFSGENSVLARYRRGGLAALLPDDRSVSASTGDLTKEIEALGWFVVAASFFYSLTNRTWKSGSVPEAVRKTISLPNLPNGWSLTTRRQFERKLAEAGFNTVPECPKQLREAILARQAEGAPLVPKRIHKQIMVNPSIIHRQRSPHDWALDNLSAPGSQRRYFNVATSNREIMLPGDWFGGDDATPGIGLCVPSDQVRTPCAIKFGVLVGRFQWLAYHDASTDKILAWDYVVRPRGSYRAEDIVNGMGAVTRVHGVPRKGWQFEGGSFNARLVRDAIKLLGCEHWRTYSPHQKAIESVFNRVWTRLALQFPHADMGRFRNENERNCAIYEACKQGHKDPRQYFPTLEIVLAIFTEEVAAHNSKLIVSEQYGRWVPDDLFAQSVSEKPLRQFNQDMAWIFSPFSVERKVRGMMARCRVPMFEDFSVPFEFSADWMPLHNGKTVRMHFNPREPRCTAKVVLMESHGQFKEGEILGDAQLIGETAGHIRLIMGWADDNQRAGYIARQRTANFMRRETRGVGANGQIAYAKSEQRDGIGQVATVERGCARESTAEVQPEASRVVTNAATVVPEFTPVDRAARLREIEEHERQHAHLFQ